MGAKVEFSPWVCRLIEDFLMDTLKEYEDQLNEGPLRDDVKERCILRIEEINQAVKLIGGFQ